MAVDNWPTITPGETPASDVDVAMGVSVVTFGDDYAQRTVDGLNAVRLTYSVQYGLLNATMATTLRNFLNAHNGGQAVAKATVPTDGIVRYWMISGYKESVDTPTTKAFSIMLTQVFDIV